MNEGFWNIYIYIYIYINILLRSGMEGWGVNDKELKDNSIRNCIHAVCCIIYTYIYIYAIG